MSPEQRAANKALAAEIKAEQAGRPAPAATPVQYNKPASQSVEADAAAAQNNASQLSSQIDEIYARSGGYLKNQSTDHMN